MGVAGSVGSKYVDPQILAILKRLDNLESLQSRRIVKDALIKQTVLSENCILTIQDYVSKVET